MQETTTQTLTILNDSIIKPMADTIVTQENNLTKILEAAKIISENTDPWFDIPSISLTALSIMASIATLVGVGGIFMEIKRRKTSKKCQKKIILDLIRHLFINNAILEIVRSEVTASGFKMRPVDGVFSRFKTMDTDTDLGRFSVVSKNFDDIHQISLHLRNYNIVADLAEEHFADKKYPKSHKSEELKDLFKRSTDITEELIKLGKLQGLKIDRDSVKEHLNDHYTKTITEKVKNIAFNILDRDKEPYKYYDELGVGELFDNCIRKRSQKIVFTDYFKE